MSAHTPGPWRVSKEGPIVDATGEPVPFSATENTLCVTAIAAYNDLLAAAAPDLLASLRDCLKFLEKDVRSSYSEPEKTKARAAIAKATGSAA